MGKRRWLRALLLFALNTAVLIALATLGLWMSGRFVTLQQNGGDQSQSSPVDLSPRSPSRPLPTIDSDGVRNVIFIVGDGMGFSHVAAARSEIAGMNERLFFERFPFTGWQTTHSLESVYTDSASSASSLATGHKVPYRSISMDSRGRALRTVAEGARESGRSVGLVTDSYLWDATMAAFFAHVPSRRDLAEIARQMAASGAVFLAGEDHSRLIEARANGDDVLDHFRAAGFQVARSAAELDALAPDASQPALALLAPNEIADPEIAPGLLDLARFGLAKVSRNPHGFFLVVESEEPDSGGHRRDLGRIVRGIRAINEVAVLAVEHAMADRSTLVLITADHETGGIDLLHGDAEHTLGIRWSTSSHSAEPVPIYAFGAGAERFSGVKDNTEIARTLAELLGLEMFAAESGREPAVGDIQ